MPRILWLRSAGRGEDTTLVEQQTGVKLIVSNGSAQSWHHLIGDIQVMLIELPLAPGITQDALISACQSPTPVPVVLYDPESALDENLVGPSIFGFDHITERLTATELAAILSRKLERAAGLFAKAPKEQWRDLLIGESPAMRSLHAMIRLTAPRRSTVLITGESGTGKEMVARAIHMASSRAGAHMVAVNCAAIPENLVESELFGHVRGAYTGAVTDRAGQFEQAHRGSIFLDEIGEIPVETQPKLLRVLQEREVQRVGSSNTIQVDTRVIAASNRDLEQAVVDGQFREDLLYRLNVVPIVVPPLRARRTDVPLLSDHFLEKICRREELGSKHLSGDALRRLNDYDWPGNVRQLEHTIEMAVTLSGERSRLYSGDIQLPERRTSSALPSRGASSPSSASLLAGREFNLEKTVERVEHLLIQEALQHHGGNKAKAAGSLGIPRTTLLYKLRNATAVA
jgi:transcriptional regulator with GAF, ATPase, and Fis domain